MAGQPNKEPSHGAGKNSWYIPSIPQGENNLMIVFQMHDDPWLAIKCKIQAAMFKL